MGNTAENSIPAEETQATDTSLDVTPAKTTDTVTNEPVEKEPAAETEQTNQEPKKLYAGKYETVEDLEKGYKESEKYITRASELEKELETLKSQVPQQSQIINEQGKVNPQFEQQFNHQVEDFEFTQYQTLATRLDPETVPEAMQKLNQAKQCYAMGDTNSYKTLMNEVKEYFNPQYVEQIAEQKAEMKAQKSEYIKKAIFQHKAQAVANLETELRKNNEIWELVDPENENYSKDVSAVVKEYFDNFGGIDTERLGSFLKAVEANGVRKHKADLEAKKAAETGKQKANISGGTGAEIQTNGNPADINSKEYWDDFYSKK